LIEACDGFREITQHHCDFAAEIVRFGIRTGCLLCRYPDAFRLNRLLRVAQETDRLQREIAITGSCCQQRFHRCRCSVIAPLAAQKMGECGGRQAMCGIPVQCVAQCDFSFILACEGMQCGADDESGFAARRFAVRIHLARGAEGCGRIVAEQGAKIVQGDRWVFSD